MSVIIIGNGGKAMVAVHALIGASISMTPEQITVAENLLKKFVDDVENICYATELPCSKL